MIVLDKVQENKLVVLIQIKVDFLFVCCVEKIMNIFKF